MWQAGAGAAEQQLPQRARQRAGGLRWRLAAWGSGRRRRNPERCLQGFSWRPALHPPAYSKNKTLGAIFRQGSTAALLEQNHLLAAALHRGVDGAEVDLVASIQRMAVDGGGADGAGPSAGGGGGGSDGEDEDEDGGSDEEMEEGGAQGAGVGKRGGQRQKRRRGKASEGFKEQVMGVLTEAGYADKRSAKLSQDDFLRLLAAFNAAGIHFA